MTNFKHPKKPSDEILNAIATWRLIYDEERDIYVKVAYATTVKTKDINKNKKS